MRHLNATEMTVLDRVAYFGTPGYTDLCRSMPGRTYTRALRRLEALGLIVEVSRGSREITEAGWAVLNAGVLAA